MTSYHIRCVCGETVTVEAPSQAQAVKRLVSAMEGHLAGPGHTNMTEHLPSELTPMVKARMQRA